MVRRVPSHSLFAPILVLAVFAVGALTIAFLLVGPGLGPWADLLLTTCFGWNPDTRHYRLDSLLLALLQPPLFAAVVFLFYSSELRVFFRSGKSRFVVLLGPVAFVALAASLLATSEISASGANATPTSLKAPIRRGTPAPTFDLVDHRGQRVSLADLRGRPVVLTFFYADCHASCPILIARLKDLEAHIGTADAVFVAVTLAPERDTAAAHREAAARWELGARWHLLTGEPGPVGTILKEYGVHRVALPDGEIAHDNVMMLIDRQGRLAFTYRGLAHPVDRQLADLERLIRERA